MNDQPMTDTDMTNDQIVAAFTEFFASLRAAQSDPPTYRETQHYRYTTAKAQGRQNAANDALWRAASDADMLTPDEYNHWDLTPARVDELIALLGWTP